MTPTTDDAPSPRRRDLRRQNLRRREPARHPRTPTALPSTTRAGLRSYLALSFATLLAAATSLSTVAPTWSSPTIVSSANASVDSAADQLFDGDTTPAMTVDRDGYTVLQQKTVAVVAAATAPTSTFRTAPTYTNNPASAVQWPFPVGVPISSDFGPRNSPGGIGSTNHKGVDFTPGLGTPISAVAAGVVRTVQSTDRGGLGVHVVIDHVIDGQTVSSWYGHMLTGSPLVSEGDAVLPGQLIGSVGNTGVSTGAHTHLEIHVDDTPVDPFDFIFTRN